MVFPLWTCGIQLTRCYTHQQKVTWLGVTWCVKSVRHIPKGRWKTERLMSEESCLREIDCLTPKTKLSRYDALLNVFEDNEVVIQDDYKRRSPTMKHMYPAPTE